MKRPDKYSNWTKPRFNRSRVKVRKASERITDGDHGGLTEDKSTKWKPISKETFLELAEKGVLTAEQIKNYEDRFKKEEIESLESKFRGHKDYRLILELSKYNIATKDGAKAIGKILRENPRAASLIGQAHKLRSITESLRK